MTGSISGAMPCRAVPEDEAKFDTVTYTYYSSSTATNLKPSTLAISSIPAYADDILMC